MPLVKTNELGFSTLFAEFTRSSLLTIVLCVAIGATAFRIHCPKYADLHSKLGRQLSDLDFATIGKQKESVFGVIREAVYQMDRKLESVMKRYDRNSGVARE